MGNSHSSKKFDPRPRAQREVENSLGVQLMIPYTLSGPQVKILAVGTMTRGEFNQTADLNVNNLFHPFDAIVPELIDKGMRIHQEQTDNPSCIVHIWEGWTTQEVELFELNKAIVGKSIDKRMYGFTNELYVVRAVHSATNFGLVCGNLGCDYTGDVDEDGHPKEPKVWGYQLVKYNIDSKGLITADSKFSKVY